MQNGVALFLALASDTGLSNAAIETPLGVVISKHHQFAAPPCAVTFSVASPLTVIVHDAWRAL